MLYLITGANGAGKTLNTLKWVRQRQIEEGRPVCFNGRFDMVPDGELKDWKKIDAKDWEKEPDGTIFFFDEAQHDFPAKPAGAERPRYVTALTEHRKRGFDFYMLTQHPSLIDNNVRKLIGSPGWHRHLKRPFGGNLVSVAEYAAVDDNAHKNGASKNAEVKMVPFPKEVYTWYTSASMHTGKKKIPKQVWFFAACLILVPLMIFFALKTMSSFGGTAEQVAGQQEPTQRQNSEAQTARNEPMTTADYIASYQPRLPDLPHTAPRYDEVTKPITAPRVAACLTMRGDCKCYTQQGTILNTDKAICMQIVKHGHFEDWAIDGKENAVKAYPSS